VSTDVKAAVGKFIWHEHVSKDQEQAKRFYTELLGWELDVWKPGEADYAMIKSGDGMHGGFSSPQGDIPPHWLGHILVEDVDETITKIEGAGGQVRMGPMDMPEIGRFAIVADPQGATFSLYAAEGEPGGSQGVFVWDELHTSDRDSAKSFYPEVFGWTANDNDMGGGTIYTVFQRGEDQIGGCFDLSEGEPMPNWMVYIGTSDVDASAAKARQLGATIIVEPSDIPNMGRFAVVQDPTGAVFGLFQSTGS
jgi:predicted enzyme related to lactoylglutathione lyase